MKILVVCLSMLPIISLASGPIGQPGPLSEQTETNRVTMSTTAVYFASGKSTLSAAAKLALLPVASRYNSEKIYQIDGYSDASGTRNDNNTLSLMRARAVRDYLIDHGITPSRIKVNAYGEQRAAINIRDEQAQVQDRKVVITESHNAYPSVEALLAGSK